jgi:hypothetical protein
LAAYNQNSGGWKMKYLLMAYVNEAGFATLTKEQQEQGLAAYGAFMEAMKKANVLVGSNRLQPSASSTVVKMANGKSQVLDGPYVDSKEQIGGYFLIEAPDLDAAIAWAARCPASSHGAVELRPVWDMGALAA